MQNRQKIAPDLIETVKEELTNLPSINKASDEYARFMLEEYQGLLESDPFDPNDGSPMSLLYWEFYSFRTKELVILALGEL
jgi:hypothetical protein